MKNKGALVIVIAIGLIAALSCRQWLQNSNNSNAPGTANVITKQWDSYDLPGTDVKVDLPAQPKDHSPTLPPPGIKEVFSNIHIYAYDEKEFSAGITELVPAVKRKWTIKDLADTSMASVKKQLTDLTYTVDVRSDTNAKYNGTFRRNGKTFELRGCCVYKPTKPARIWAVITFYPKDSADLENAGQKVIDSVVFKDTSEECE